MSTGPSGNCCRSLRGDALAVWHVAVTAVDSQRLVQQAVTCHRDVISLCGRQFPLDQADRLCVVGGGKAGAGMAAGFEAALAGSTWADRVSGWVNVPDDCVRTLRSIHLHPARPAARNEPTEAGVVGSNRILDLVAVLGPRDVCVVLLSGGGSALLPAPVPEISLADKQAVTRMLSRAGASIRELNCVRKQLSRIKGGGLARACRAGTLVALIISDVIGDPLETIASGPTVPNTETPADALAVLRKFSGPDEQAPASVIAFLERQSTHAGDRNDARDSTLSTLHSRLSTLHNHVIGNNRVALDAAARKAAELGYSIDSLVTDQAGIARDVGVALADQCLALRDHSTAPRPVCLLSGGEPVVHVVETDRPQKGGRNQELVLAAALRLWTDGMERICLVSGGTDGEDGPTDAAGAVADAALITRAKTLGLDPAEFLRWNNAYPFLEQAGGLLKTGPTHTNVMDVRVALVDPP